MVHESTTRRGNIAVLHLAPVGSRNEVIHKLQKIILYTSSYNVKLYVLPYNYPYGFHDYCTVGENVLKEKMYVKMESKFINKLMNLAKNYGVNILLSGFIEKTSKRMFVSSIIASSFGSLLTYRKIVVDPCEEELGIKRGGVINCFELDFTKVSVSIDQEILYPEVIRFKCVSSDLLIHYGGFGSNVNRDLALLKNYSTIYATPTILVGGIFEGTNGLFNVPTVILDNGGNVLYEYSGMDEAVIIISISKIVGKVKKPELNNDNIKHIYRLLRKNLYAGKRGSRDR